MENDTLFGRTLVRILANIEKTPFWYGFGKNKGKNREKN